MPVRFPRLRLAAMSVGAVTVLLVGALTGAATASAASSVAPAVSPSPISSNTFFSGLVNGQNPGTIKVVCSASAAKSGHPADGQSVEAILASSVAGATTGYTGSLGTSLTVSISAGGTTSLIGVLNNFYETLAIPTSLDLPCSGTGTVAFAPTPTSATATTAAVAVKLVSSAGSTPTPAPRA